MTMNMRMNSTRKLVALLTMALTILLCLHRHPGKDEGVILLLEVLGRTEIVVVGHLAA